MNASSFIVYRIYSLDGAIASIASKYRRGVFHLLHLLRKESLRLVHHRESRVIDTLLIDYFLLRWRLQLRGSTIESHCVVVHCYVIRQFLWPSSPCQSIFERISPQLHAHSHYSFLAFIIINLNMDDQQLKEITFNHYLLLRTPDITDH